MGVRARTEVFGIFAAVLPQRARDVVSKWPLRKRQGLVPDLITYNTKDQRWREGYDDAEGFVAL